MPGIAVKIRFSKAQYANSQFTAAGNHFWDAEYGEGGLLMSFLIVSGIVLLSLLGLANAFVATRLFLAHHHAQPTNLILCLMSLGYASVSVAFRVNTSYERVNLFVASIGVLLSGFAIIWAYQIIRHFALVSTSSVVILLPIALALLVFITGFLRSEIIIEPFTLPSGLIRYKLSGAGNYLFSFSFLVIFSVSIIALANFKRFTGLQIWSHVFVILSLAGVIFPWKELGLNVVFLCVATILNGIAELRQNTFL